MVMEIQNIEWDLCKTVETENNIRDRLQHCSEALEVLSAEMKPVGRKRLMKQF